MMRSVWNRLGAIHHRRGFDLARDRIETGFHQPGGERRKDGEVDQRQPEDIVEQAEIGKAHVERHRQRHRRQHVGGDHHVERPADRRRARDRPGGRNGERDAPRSSPCPRRSRLLRSEAVKAAPALFWAVESSTA